MSRSFCQQIIANMTGTQVSEADVLRLEERVRARMRRMQQMDSTLTENTAAREAVTEIVSEAKAAVSAKRRAVLLNESKRMQAEGRITGQWSRQYGLGLRSLVTGTQRNVKGARISAAGAQDVVKIQLLGGLHSGLKRLGQEVCDLFTSDALETDVARALWHLARETPDAAELGKLHPSAVAIAKVIHTQQELSRVMQNREGAAIGSLDGYITRQSHDVVRIAADMKGWMASAGEHFDLPRMMAEMGYDDPQAMLADLYKPLSTGLHLKVTEPPSPTVKRGLGSLANKLSKERVIHFKSADDFLAYNKTFGAGNLRESVAHGLERSAKAIGLMQVLGTNPAAFLDAMENRLTLKLRTINPTAKEVERFHRDVAGAKKRLLEVDGSLDIPGHSTLAKWAQNYRALKTMASLGGSMLSSFGDVATFIVSARHNGVGFFDACDAAMRGIFSARNPLANAERAQALGMVFDSLSGHVANRFSLDEGGRGALSSMQQLYYKLNLQNWWSDGLRFAGANMLSHNLAGHAGSALISLPGELQHTLNLYGIGDAEWNIARKHVQAGSDGKAFISPDGIADEAVSAKLRAYFTDQNGYMLLSPDAETRYIVKAGTQKGTVSGEVMRMMAQFKSFTVSFNQRMIGRELIGNIDVNTRGTGAVLKAASKSGAAWIGMTQLVALTTAFGYLSMAAKDTLKGKVPRDPTDPRTAIAALQQGGGMGIMSDFLFSRSSRTGGDALQAAMGPFFGDVGNLIKTVNDYRDSVTDPDSDHAESLRKQAGDELFRLTYSNIPGNNLFYVKPVLDYLLMWHVNEMLNPGAGERMEANAARQGQTYFISPAQRAREQGVH